MRKNNKTKYYFLHIPKVGGTTIASILSQNYPQSRRFHISQGKRDDRFFHELINLTKNQQNKIHVVTGHIWFGIHKYIQEDKNFKYFTFLRDPVKRVISHYYYAKRKPEHYLRDKINEQKISLSEYVDGFCNEVLNGQSIQISGLYLKNNYRFDQQIYKETFNEDELLARALKNIKNHFAFVGIMEDFDKSVSLMQKTLGLNKTLCYYKKRNVNKSKQNNYEISDDVISLIKQKNAVDIKLYNICKEKFYKNFEDYNQNIPDFSNTTLKKKVIIKIFYYINRFL